jgi:hypothetical protein
MSAGSLFLATFLGLGSALLFACAGPERQVAFASQTDPAIVAVYRSRCGTCHVPVEPGSRNRQDLDAAFKRHRSRVHLTNEQWQRMAEGLASSTRPTGHWVDIPAAANARTATQ